MRKDLCTVSAKLGFNSLSVIAENRVHCSGRYETRLLQPSSLWNPQSSRREERDLPRGTTVLGRLAEQKAHLL